MLIWMEQGLSENLNYHKNYTFLSVFCHENRLFFLISEICSFTYMFVKNILTSVIRHFELYVY